MTISNNKRELEKKKALKKKDKQRRKEERRSSGPSSFDDMIAYVDANGNICDTPPEEDEVEEIEADSILVSTPKREDIVEEKPEGRVDFFDDNKGFGFIRTDNSQDRYFFHISNAPDDIKMGDRVTFDIERGDRGLNAVAVEHLKA